MLKLAHTMKRLNTEYFKNLVFGIEDSLVSTVGVLFGLASSPNTFQKQILLSGFIIISVEALSMGAGAFLTETSAHELDGRKLHGDSPVIDGIVMFLSYFIAGFIPISAYLIFGDVGVAKYVSLILTLISLFILGYAPTKKLKAAIRMMVVASMAASVGFIVAEVFKQI